MPAAPVVTRRSAAAISIRSMNIAPSSAAGSENTIQGLADHSVIGAGQNNFISGSAGPVYAVIGGGYGNLTQTNSAYPFIGGGYGNTIQSNSFYAVIPGGYANVAGGSGSFAAGSYARATNNGAFVWSDTSITSVFNSTSRINFSFAPPAGWALERTTSGRAACGWWRPDQHRAAD